MVTYQYRCGRDGLLEVARPIGTAPPAVPCPGCGEPAPRVFTPPLLGLAPRRVVAAIDRAEASRYEPAVVSAPPRRPAHLRTPVAPPNPALRRLPRP
jgi:hypothetical protein